MPKRPVWARVGRIMSGCYSGSLRFQLIFNHWNSSSGKNDRKPPIFDGWWFGTFKDYFFHHIGNVIIPADWHHGLLRIFPRLVAGDRGRLLETVGDPEPGVGC